MFPIGMCSDPRIEFIVDLVPIRELAKVAGRARREKEKMDQGDATLTILNPWKKKTFEVDAMQAGFNEIYDFDHAFGSAKEGKQELLILGDYDYENRKFAPAPYSAKRDGWIARLDAAKLKGKNDLYSAATDAKLEGAKGVVVYGDTPDFRLLQVGLHDRKPVVPMVYVNRPGLKHVCEKGAKLVRAERKGAGGRAGGASMRRSSCMMSVCSWAGSGRYGTKEPQNPHRIFVVRVSLLAQLVVVCWFVSSRTWDTRRGVYPHNSCLLGSEWKTSWVSRQGNSLWVLGGQIRLDACCSQVCSTSRRSVMGQNIANMFSLVAEHEKKKKRVPTICRDEELEKKKAMIMKRRMRRRAVDGGGGSDDEAEESAKEEEAEEPQKFNWEVKSAAYLWPTSKGGVMNVQYGENKPLPPSAMRRYRYDADGNMIFDAGEKFGGKKDVKTQGKKAFEQAKKRERPSDRISYAYRSSEVQHGGGVISSADFKGGRGGRHTKTRDSLMVGSQLIARRTSLAAGGGRVTMKGNTSVVGYTVFAEEVFRNRESWLQASRKSGDLALELMCSVPDVDLQFRGFSMMIGRILLLKSGRVRDGAGREPRRGEGSRSWQTSSRAGGLCKKKPF